MGRTLDQLAFKRAQCWTPIGLKLGPKSRTDSTQVSFPDTSHSTELRPWSRLTAAQIEGISRNSPSVREEQASPEETEIISLLVKAALLLVKKRFVRDVTFCDHVTLGESAGQTSKIG